MNKNFILNIVDKAAPKFNNLKHKRKALEFLGTPGVNNKLKIFQNITTLLWVCFNNLRNSKIKEITNNYMKIYLLNLKNLIQLF